MIAYRACTTTAKLLLGVVAIDVRHTITMVILTRLHLFIFSYHLSETRAIEMVYITIRSFKGETMQEHE